MEDDITTINREKIIDMRLELTLFLLILLTCSNCALISVSGIDDYKKAKQRHEVEKIRASTLEAKYINLPKESVIEELGKPNEVMHREFSYFIDQDCRRNGCPEGKSDEVWIYDFKIMDETGLTFSEIWIYMKEGKIVRIAG